MVRGRGSGGKQWNSQLFWVQLKVCTFKKIKNKSPLSKLQELISLFPSNFVI